MNSKDIELIVARHFGTFRNIIVPNVSHGFGPCGLWEMDLAIMTGSGYLYEVEIKTSVADLRRDQKKQRWTIPVWLERFESIVSRYYVAIPESVLKKLNGSHDCFPECAGILAIDDAPSQYSRVRMVRPTSKKRGRKLTDGEMLKLARLGTIRYWTRHSSKITI